MDFRSQLSAFQNNRGGSGGGRGNNNNNNNDRSRSPNRRYDDHYGRGGGGGYGGDRRRPRPPEWGNNPHYGGGPPPYSRRRFNPPQDPDALGDLRGFGYKITKGFPDPPTSEEMNKKTKHIALLAITIDDMPYEHLWRGWCETLNKSIQSDQDDYFISFICHAKYPRNVKSEWLRQRLITHPPKRGRGNSFEDPTVLTRTPAWGSVEITRAMLDLLQDGLKIGNCTQTDQRFSANRNVVRTPQSFEPDADSNTEEGKARIPPVDHFLFISETCVPVATAPEFFSKIANVAVSWVNARHRRQENTPKNKYEDDQFACIHRRIPGQYRWKADQWVLLSRRHASQVVGLDRPHMQPKHQLWKSFEGINASDEMFFPTALALLGFLRFTQDGDDTQRARSNVSVTDAASTAPMAAVTPGDGPEVTPDKPPLVTAPSEASLPTVATNKNECILLRPVTYTDWTEGMRNPATFCHGTKDLKRIGKLAREKGCLVARKFQTHIAIPGVPKDEQKITGEISLGQWNEVILELHEQEVNSKSIQPYPSESIQEVEVNQDRADDEANKSSSENQGEEIENGGANADDHEDAKPEEDAAVENGPDDENELE